jgi:hypothetical protein
VTVLVLVPVSVSVTVPVLVLVPVLVPVSVPVSVTVPVTVTAMGKYRKKPIVVEAVQWFKASDHAHVIWIKEWYRFVPTWQVKGKQGWVNVNPGDWILPELDGSGYYLCADSVFKETYELVEE